MEVSRDGILFHARREGLALGAYQDGKHMSIGFGSNKPGLRQGDTITVPEAFKDLVQNIRDRERLLNVLLKVDVKQHQYDALSSLLYQAGRDDLEPVVKLVNAGKIEEAAKEFLEHDVNAKGEHLPGLLARRFREANLFYTGEYGDINPIPYWRGNPRAAGVKQERYHVTEKDLPMEGINEWLKEQD